MIISLAPLHGVTNKIYRKAWLSFFSGIDEILAPFVGTISVSRMKESHFKDIQENTHRETSSIPLIPQLLGNDPDDFIATAKTVRNFGYTEVNWNLGCPYPMVAKKRRGSGLLPYTDQIQDFLSKVCPELESISMKLSVKVRLGWSNPNELLSLMPIFNAQPLSRIVIHPRLGNQMYSGTVNIDVFEQAAHLSRHPVGYNGDIRSVKHAKDIQTKFPFLHEIMIGRALIANPFLAAEIAGHKTGVNKIEKIKEFHVYLLESYQEILFGGTHVLDKMKEVWTYMGSSFSGVSHELHDLSRAKTLESYTTAVDGIFSGGEWNS